MKPKWPAAVFKGLGPPRDLFFTFNNCYICTNKAIKVVALTVYITGHLGCNVNIFQFKDGSRMYPCNFSQL